MNRCMFLCKYTTYSSVRYITFNVECYSKIRQGKKKMATKCIEYGAHIRLFVVSLMTNNLFSNKSIKKGRYVCKMASKATTIIAETNEHLQYFDIGGRGLLLNSLSILRIGFNSATWYDIF